MSWSDKSANFLIIDMAFGYGPQIVAKFNHENSCWNQQLDT